MPKTIPEAVLGELVGKEMTVAELIAKLKQCDPSTMVVMAAYESGFNELEDVETLELTLNNPTILGSTYHIPNWVETVQGRNFVAICLGPMDPSRLDSAPAASSSQR